MKSTKKLVFILAVMILFIIINLSIVSAATLKVGTKEKYHTIQSAVNASHKGDTIIVNSGTYYETVKIKTDSLTILGINNPKVDGFTDYADPYIQYEKGNININGFSIIKNGIELGGYGAQNEIIKNNYFYSCNAYITGEMASGIIKNNDFTDGGIILIDSGVAITGNKIRNVDIGIQLDEGIGGNTSASISENTITGCNIGIKFDGYVTSTVYDNYFNNKKNIIFDLSYPSWSVNHLWNTTKTPNYNIVLGPYIGGNFWGSPNGKGFSQTAADKNYDGIADSPYKIDSNNTDYLPLVAIKSPVTLFKMSKSSGKVPLTVSFIDISKGVNMTEKWSFGDRTISTLKNPSHTYQKMGKFKVTLTETNKIGSNSKSQFVTVTK